MAQFAEDGTSHQNLTFNYTPDWFASASAFGPLPDHLPNQSLLDPSESAVLQNFFDNPDYIHNVSMSSAMDLKQNNPFTGQAQGGFAPFVDDGGKTFNDAAATLHSSTPQSYDAHSNQPHRLPQGHVNTMQRHHSTVDASEDEFNAASGLFNMSNRRGHGQASLGDFGTSGSWGLIGSDHTPMASETHIQPSSLRRQSTSSYNDLTANGHSLSYNQYQNPSTWMFADQPNPRNRQHSYDALGNNYTLGARQAHHPSYLSDSDFSRSTLIRYGSDPHFSQNGYQAPRTYHQDEKGGNLMNVPLAQQAAASASALTHAGSAGISQKMYADQSTLGRATARNLSSAIDRPKSTSSVRGLAISSPLSGTHPHGHPRHVAPTTIVHAVDDDDDDDDDDLKQTPPPKRKKSTAADTDRVKSKRSSFSAKHPANVVEDEDESEYEEEEEDDYALTSQPSAKRRKSSGAGAMSPTSDDASSPPPTGSGRKKKARNSEARRNLSHEQKRQNHIRSEKNRRDLIKNNYGDLNSLVPALNNGKSGLSKAEALSEIVAFVEMMTDGNKLVERKLREWRAIPAAGGASSRAGASG